MNIDNNLLDRIKELFAMEQTYDQAINIVLSLMKGEEYLSLVGIDFKWVQIPDGVFKYQNVIETPVKGFKMTETVITEYQWNKLFNIPVKAHHINTPKVDISWDDANKFCKIVSDLTGKNICLPHEVEWEYAAKANNDFKYSGSNTYLEVASDTTNKTCQSKPNNWNLYDMSGCVWEWCSNVFYWSDEYKKDDEKVLKGGSTHSPGRCSEITYRFGKTKSSKGKYLGFRIIQRD